MRTNIVLDESLVEKAQELTGILNSKSCVCKASAASEGLVRRSQSFIRLQAEADNLAAQMQEFETAHSMKSAEFHRQFQAGAIGDDADLFEWSALYQVTEGALT